MNQLWWQQYRGYGVVLGTGVLIVGFWYLCVEPLRRDNRTLLEQIQSIQTDAEITESQSARLNDMRQQVEHIHQTAGAFDVTAPQGDPIHWVHELEVLAQSTGNHITIETDDALLGQTEGAKKVVKSTDKQKNTADEGSLLSEIPQTKGVGIRLTLEGDYASLSLFLKKLELSPHYVDIISMNIARQDADHQSRVSTATFSASPFAPAPTSDDSKPLADALPLQAVFESIIYTHE
jgi:hypothetical protein